MSKRFLAILLLITICGSSLFAAAQGYTNPLLNPQRSVEKVTLGQKYVNILFLGIDLGHEGYWGSGHKTELENCHTDALMVVSLNVDKQTVDIVSVPRDTLTYVPGVKGIYKLNAAINCGTDMEDGLEKARAAVEWALGGIPIDYYCAVDMNAMAAIGDAIGGVDFELEMSYTGSSGAKYKKGLRHLDGTGIMDYLRARRNATVNANDLGRTGRQRDLMTAIFSKLISNQALLLKLIANINEIEGAFFTDIDVTAMIELVALVPIVAGIDKKDVGSHVITGKYRTALMGWNFTFTDQAHRKKVIKEVYQVDVEPLAYVEYAYTTWLVDSGFKVIHQLAVAQQLAAHLETVEAGAMTAEQASAKAAFLLAVDETKSAFEQAAITMKKADTSAMDKARIDMQRKGNAAAELFSYRENLPWVTGKYWYADPLVNEVSLDWR